jgi:hypothetical protein
LERKMDNKPFIAPDKDKIAAELKKVFPNGHERYIPILIDLMELHSTKNHDYAAGGDSLGNFHRVSTILGLYPGLKLSDPFVVTMAYMMKQLDAVLWMKSNGHTAKVEGIGKRLDDVIVYGTIAKILEEDKK